MQYPYYSFSVPVFRAGMVNLLTILDKAIAFAGERKVKDAVILETRLAVDMLPFARQVQIASDNAKGTCARLAGIAAPVMEDSEADLAALKMRCQKTIAFLDSLTPEQFSEAAERKVALPYFPDSHFLGKEFLPLYGLPNFFFHVVTAYDILRHLGVPIGKADFLGEVPRYNN